MASEIVALTKGKNAKLIEALKRELGRLRTGRASPSLLDGVKAEYYGSQLALNQVATITVVEGRTLVLSPWDKAALAEIEKAIQKSDLSLTPVNDGKVVRISLPAPTEERRKELVRQAKKIAEESRVLIRNSRRDGNEAVKKLQKDGKLSEDELKRVEGEIQKLTDQFIGEVDSVLAHKEKEILEI
jgi:ribosome recycling factor